MKRFVFQEMSSCILQVNPGGKVDPHMNDRLQDQGFIDLNVLKESSLVVPVSRPPDSRSGAGSSQLSLPLAQTPKKNGYKAHGRREPLMQKDAVYIVKRDDIHHIISENYYYKTEPYYTILSHELEGEKVEPGSSAVLDAYIIPLCLERAALQSIPVCEWGISQAYVPLPAILYGLNYFATTLDYVIVRDNEEAKEAIKHITNNGKYPFCYQKYPENAEICTCTAIFGRTIGACSTIADYALKVYGIFKIPLVKMVFVRSHGNYALSSLSPIRYAHLSENERELLSAYLSHQEFL